SYKEKQREKTSQVRVPPVKIRVHLRQSVLKSVQTTRFHCRKRMRALLVLLFIASTAMAGNWPAWRGPLGTGITEETNLPLKWSKNENVKWRIPLPEPGNSTPIIWGDRIFLTQAMGDRRMLKCFTREKGQLLWERGITTKEKEPTHQTNPYCSASPVTDGERVIASFASDGLFCYDFAGKLIWSR